MRFHVFLVHRKYDTPNLIANLKNEKAGWLEV
jgi:hypothetical protein